MTQKISRKEMKRNDLAESVRHTFDYVTHHRRGVTETVAAAAALLIVVGGFLVFRVWRERQAGQDLSAGLEVLSLPLASEPAAKNAPRSFSSEAERSKESASELAKAAAISGVAAGRAAAVVLAARATAPADVDAFAKAARESSREIATAGEIGAARLLASQGKVPEAIDRLRRAIDSKRTTAPKDALLFALGEICEQAGNPAEGKAAFERIVNEFPDSPYRQDARQKI